MGTQLSNVKSTILTAGGAAVADHIDALIAHLTTAPNLWELDASVASTGLTAVLKTPYTGGALASVDPMIGIRTDGSNIKTMTDPGKAIPSGTISTGFTGSSEASPESSFTHPTSLYTKSLLTEIQDCLIWMIPDSTQSFVKWIGIFGHGIYPDGGYKEQGADGFVCLSGIPRATPSSASGYLFSTTSDGYAKAGNVSAKWGAASVALSLSDGEILEPDDNGTPVYLPRFPSVIANDVGLTTQDDPKIGYSKYFAFAPTRIIGTQNSFTVFEGANQAWLFVNYTGSATAQIVPWEKGVSLSGL